MAQSRQERIESKREKRSDKREQKGKNLRRKSDEILRQFLDIKDEDSQAEAKRERLKDKYFNIAPFKHQDFDFDVEEYKNRMKSMADNMAEPEPGMEMGTESDAQESPEMNIADLLDQRLELKNEVEANLKNKVNLSRVAQEFYDQHLVPDDIAGGDNQIAAIRVAFSSNPELAKKMEALVSMSKEDRETYSGLVEDTKSFLRNTRDKLAAVYGSFKEMRKTSEKLSGEVTGEYLKGKINNIISNFKEKPLVSLTALAGIVAFIYWIKTGEKTKGIRKTIWEGLQVAAVGGGGLLGLNELVSVYRDDGRSLADLMFSNPDTYSYDSTMANFKDELEKMTDNNRYAFEAMMHIANVEGDTVLALFDEADRSPTGKKEINIRALKSLSGLSQQQAGKVNGEGLYIGLEALMLKVYKQYGKNKISNKDSQITEGKRIFKEKFAGMKLASIIFAIEQDGMKGGKRGRKGIDASGSSLATDGGSLKEGAEIVPEKPGDVLNIDIIEGAFAPIMEYDSGLTGTVGKWFGDNKLQAMLGMRKTWYANKTLDITQSDVLSEEQMMTDIGALKKQMDREIERYLTFSLSGNKGSEVVLSDIEAKMAGNTVPDLLWKDSAEKVFSTLHSYEFEDWTHVIDEPQIIVSIMQLFEKKISGGENQGGAVKAEDAEKYTKYFIKQLTDLMSNKANWSLGNLGGEIKEINVDAFKSNQNKLNTIQSFDEWLKNPEEKDRDIAINDRKRTIEERREKERDAIPQAAKDAIDKAFKSTKKMEFALVRDTYESFVGRRKQAYLEEIMTKVAGKSAEEAKDIIDEVAKRAKTEAESYFSYSERASGTAPVLAEIQDKMIEQRITNDDWHESSRKTLHYFSERYEVEGWTYIKDEPEILVQLMDWFYKKINEGRIALTDAGKTPEDYRKYFILQVRNILPKDTNMDAFNTDGHIKQVNVKEWAQIQNKMEDVMTYEQFVANPVSAPEVQDNDLGRATFEREQEDGTEIMQYKEQSIADVNRSFDKVESLDGSWLPSNFKSFVGLRRQWYVDEMNKRISGKTEDAARKILDHYAKDAQAEAQDYQKFESRKNSGSPVVLMEAEKVMLDKMVVVDWKKSGEKVLQYANAAYEFENQSYVIDDPEMFNDFMQSYFSRITNSSVSEQESADYTRYFLHSMQDLLPNDKNWAVGSVRKQVSNEEWEAGRNARDQIMSYTEWVAAGRPKKPELHENNATALEKERVEQEKVKSNADFMKWFDKEMDPSQWLRWDGAWPEIFRKEVENRLYILSNNSAYHNGTNEDYKNTLQNYTKYVKVEKRIFEGLIDAKIEPKQLVGTDMTQTFLQKTIKNEFNANFSANKTPQEYNDALEKALKTKVLLAEVIDTLTVRIGPLYIPNIDPIQFSP